MRKINNKPIPVIEKVSATKVQENYLKIKAFIENIFQTKFKNIDRQEAQEDDEHNPIKNI